MEKEKRSLSIAFGLGVVAAVLTLLLGAIIVAYTGAYNVAATEDHTAFGRWTFETTMHNSVESRAEGIEIPPSVGDVVAGAAEYKAMCEHCHAGPGTERAEWAQGMLPQPPHLTEHAAEWAPNQIFWLVKHGIKMTGMPAFGPSHDDQTLWNIAAFVKRLPGMTAQDYAAFESGHDGAHSGRHQH